MSNLVVGTQLQYVQVKMSASLKDVCADVIALANVVMLPVIFEFNNVIAVVHPDSQLNLVANLIFTTINSGGYTRKYVNCPKPVKK